MATGDRLKWFLSKLGDVDFVNRIKDSKPLPEEAPLPPPGMEPGVTPPPPPPAQQPPGLKPLGDSAFEGIEAGPSPLDEPVQTDAEGNSPLRDKVRFMALMNNKTSGARPPKSAFAGGGRNGY